jgi:hypothetical protein
VRLADQESQAILPGVISSGLFLNRDCRDSSSSERILVILGSESDRRITHPPMIADRRLI